MTVVLFSLKLFLRLRLRVDWAPWLPKLIVAVVPLACCPLLDWLPPPLMFKLIPPLPCPPPILALTLVVFICQTIINLSVKIILKDLLAKFVLI